MKVPAVRPESPGGSPSKECDRDPLAVQGLQVKAEGFFFGGKIDHAKLENTLNLLGHDGWELVSIVTVNANKGITEDIAVVLKRPVAEAPTG